MKQGDPIWFSVAVKGAYGYPSRDVPAVFVAWTPKRARIEIILPDGRRRQADVGRNYVRPREVPA